MQWLNVNIAFFLRLVPRPTNGLPAISAVKNFNFLNYSEMVYKHLIVDQKMDIAINFAVNPMLSMLASQLSVVLQKVFDLDNLVSLY